MPCRRGGRSGSRPFWRSAKARLPPLHRACDPFVERHGRLPADLVAQAPHVGLQQRRVAGPLGQRAPLHEVGPPGGRGHAATTSRTGTRRAGADVDRTLDRRVEQRHERPATSRACRKSRRCEPSDVGAGSPRTSCGGQRGHQPVRVLVRPVHEEDPPQREAHAAPRREALRDGAQRVLAGPVVGRGGERRRRLRRAPPDQSYSAQLPAIVARRPPASGERASSPRLASTHSAFSGGVQNSPGTAYQAKCSRCVGRTSFISAAARPGSSRSHACHARRALVTGAARPGRVHLVTARRQHRHRVAADEARPARDEHPRHGRKSGYCPSLLGDDRGRRAATRCRTRGRPSARRAPARARSDGTSGSAPRTPSASVWKPCANPTGTYSMRRVVGRQLRAEPLADRSPSRGAGRRSRRRPRRACSARASARRRGRPGSACRAGCPPAR